ncbi:CDP-alcohol phosphatidyltransferase family protein [Actibacterium sp. 188UL27-1]|uniref:CDP-alcohol phosphatidyltransferase family protein n=1 Tax=Actibacterium sp. 188UL27-1 TaxID=2786961 RepID=UPI001957FF6D|nr:CDP-alcohol phosphatidyltransferase family protein [Actibacterium sp. 188UL27-1]MBM7069264.1 CDP-alcohol phosphatidyltransferase family protein [Actibacterium sp. 188UL27-1]
MERLISHLPGRHGHTDRIMPPVMLLWAAVPLSIALFLAAHLIDPSADWLAEIAAVSLFWVACLITVRSMTERYVYDRLGPANTVTTLRMAMAALLIVPVVEPAALNLNALTLFAVALTALALDGVDGWLARRFKMASEFGARFDMEVDALIAGLLALSVFQSGKVGALILVLGFMRYAFVVTCQVWPWLGGDLPESLRRKAVCVIQIGTLVLLLLPAVDGEVAIYLTATAVLSLIYSFAVDVTWLARRR